MDPMKTLFGMAQEPATVAVRSGAREGRATAQSLGVIDLGSNTARLVVFGISSSGVIWPRSEAKEVPRLGLDTDVDGRLSDEAMERGIEALGRFAAALKPEGAIPTLAVATSAVRDAPNGDDFVVRVRRATGIPLRILSGPEEARLAYLGVASAWELHDDLVCDLGGGSLQLGLVLEGRLRNSVSLPLGTLRLMRRFIAEDPPREKELDRLREHLGDVLHSTVDAFGATGSRLFAVGGTIRALARAAINIQEYPVPSVHGYVLRKRQLSALSELLLEMTTEKRKAVPGIGSDRADVIVPGLLMFTELLRVIREDEIVVSGTGIREGLALEAIGVQLPATGATLVDRSISAASETLSFGIDRARALQEGTLSLFDGLADRFGWAGSERLALGAASGLHDAGISIDLWHHAEHAAYLLEHYPVWGLSHREMLLAALVARLHEGDGPPPHWRKDFAAVVRPNDLETGQRLSVLLFSVERLRSYRPKWSVGQEGKLLRVAIDETVGGGLPPRTLEKLRKALERGLDVSVDFHHG